MGRIAPDLAAELASVSDDEEMKTLVADWLGSSSKGASSDVDSDDDFGDDDAPRRPKREFR